MVRSTSTEDPLVDNEKFTVTPVNRAAAYTVGIYKKSSSAFAEHLQDKKKSFISETLLCGKHLTVHFMFKK